MPWKLKMGLLLGLLERSGTDKAKDLAARYTGAVESAERAQTDDDALKHYERISKIEAEMVDAIEDHSK